MAFFYPPDVPTGQGAVSIFIHLPGTFYYNTGSMLFYPFRGKVLAGSTGGAVGRAYRSTHLHYWVMLLCTDGYPLSLTDQLPFPEKCCPPETGRRQIHL